MFDFRLNRFRAIASVVITGAIFIIDKATITDLKNIDKYNKVNKAK